MTKRDAGRPRRPILTSPLGALAGVAAVAGWLTACDFETVSTELEPLRLDAAGLADLRAQVGAGRLDVVGVPELDAIEVEATLVTYAFQDVDDVREELRLELSEDLDRAFLHAHIDDELGWIDLRVRVPARLAVEIEDDSGDVDVRDVRSLRLTDDSGDVFVRGVAESLVVVDDSGDLDLEVIGGEVRVTDASGELRLSSVAGPVEITDTSGDLIARDLDDRVRIHDGSGSIRVEQARARVEITDGSGDITLVDAPDTWIMADDGGEVFRR